MAMDQSKVHGLKFEGIDHTDYPDYCDAYISSSMIGDKELTEEEIEELNNDGTYKLEKLMEYLN